MHPFGKQGPSFVPGGRVSPIHVVHFPSQLFNFPIILNVHSLFDDYRFLCNELCIHNSLHGKFRYFIPEIIQLSILAIRAWFLSKNVSEIKGSSLFDVTRSHLIDNHIRIEMQELIRFKTYLFIVPWSSNGPQKSYSHLAISMVHAPSQEDGKQPFLL